MAQWLSARLETEGWRVRASPASLRCGLCARHIYPSLVLVQPRKTRPCLTERLLMGREESNQTNTNKNKTNGAAGHCRSQNSEKVTHIKGRLLDQAVLLFASLFEKGTSIKGKNFHQEGANSFL